MNTVTMSARLFSIELQGALIVDVEQDVVAGRQLLFDLGARGAVEIVVDLGPFEQFALGLHAVEGGDVDEIIVGALDLVGAAGARGHRDGQTDIGVLPEQRAGDRGLACPRRRGNHQHDAAALKVHSGDPYSMFCTCSRN
jgi:hypothetical protein